MPDYPLLNFRFQVEWGGTKIGFKEVTGLGSGKTEEVKYRDGDSPETHDLTMPGRTTFETITLKRGTFAGDNQFFDWWNENAPGVGAHRDLTITLLNQNLAPIVVWKVKKAWPISVKSTDLKADSNDVAIEEIVLSHQGCVIQND